MPTILSLEYSVMRLCSRLEEERQCVADKEDRLSTASLRSSIYENDEENGRTFHR